MPSSLLGPLVSAGISGGANALFGGGQKDPGEYLSNFQPTGISAGGLTSGFGGGNVTMTPSAERLGAISNIAGLFGNQADLLTGLRSKVEPGYNDLLRSRLDTLNNSKLAAVGNLRDNLQRRRVLGSSFAQDAFSRTNAEYGKAADAITADSFLKSLDATQQIAQQEFTARRQQFQVGLDEMNLEANLAASLAGKATDVLGKNAQLQAEMQAKSNAGSGSFFGSLIQPIAKAAGGAFGIKTDGASGGGGDVLFGGLPLGQGGIGSA